MNLPLLNACLNASAFTLLVAGFVAIKRGRRELHERLMYAATAVSAAFLVSYVIYHLTSEETRFRREGFVRTAYLVMLFTHIVLAVVNVPLVLQTLRHARAGRFEQHMRWAKVTFPVWVYVSITGVLVYLCLYVWNPPAQP